MIKITDMTLRKLTGIPGETQKVTIGSGLQLWVTINQAGKTAKVWYLRYYDADGKRQRSKLGEYPDMSLAKAMAAAEDAKAKAKDGINLAQEKTAQKRVIIETAQAEQTQQGTTFEEVARAWLAKKSQSHASHAPQSCTFSFPVAGSNEKELTRRTCRSLCKPFYFKAFRLCNFWSGKRDLNLKKS